MYETEDLASLPVCDSLRRETKVFEDSSFKERRCTRILLNGIGLPLDNTIAVQQVRNRWHGLRPYKCIAELTHHSFDSSSMKVGSGTVEIAQRLLETPVSGFTHEPGVALGIDPRPTYRQTQFERHVEPRGSRSCSVQLYSRKIMNGIAASLYQFQDALETAYATRQPELDTRLQAELHKPNNVREVQGPKLFIVGNVQEDCG